MKTLNQLIKDYTRLLRQGEMQVAYKEILAFMGRLRADMMRRYPCYDMGSVYQGYMDMSYFSLSTNRLKDKGLKIAIVYLHEKGDFEVWLSPRNRGVAKKYESVFSGNISSLIPVFHDANNQDAMIEATLTTTPDFEDQASFMEALELGVEKFVTTVDRLL